MRIVAGRWRGRTLQAPKGMATRPTSDRVREALFSMLTSRLGGFDDLLVADLFAGSGALGFEALSRGAARCTFVEENREALAALQANARSLGAEADIRARSAAAIGPAHSPYDVVFMDPPYGSGLGAIALERLRKTGWVAPKSWISLETERGEQVDAPGYAIDTERRFGKAQLALLRPID